MDTNVKRREWVKTAAIIFLAVLLVLTFFSNTIMNASLPEVATQQVTQGTINAKIRASGTIAANETYNVKLTQTRKIESVKCKVGQEVNAGDVLFVLEAEESDELKQAQADLEAKELDYQKSLITASNGNAQEDRDVQKLRDAYNEALTIYHQYSTMDASQIAKAKATAEAKQKELEREKKKVDTELADAQADEDYVNAKSEITALETQITSLETEIEGYKEQIKELQATGGNTAGGPQELIIKKQTELNKLLADNAGDLSSYDKDRSIFYRYAQKHKGNDESLDDAAERCSKDLSLIENDLIADGYSDAQISASERAHQLAIAYNQLKEYYKQRTELENEIADLEKQVGNTEIDYSTQGQIKKLEEKRASANTKLKQARKDLSSAEESVEIKDNLIKQLKTNADNLAEQIEDQTAVVSELDDASTAADKVKDAKEKLEDKLFEVNQGDTSVLDMQAAKKAIEDAKENIEKLTKDADAQEITAKVGGTIAAVNVTAGDTASADTPLATINQTDRGFTVKISVTNEQAKKVKVGDTAELVNYWGDATATLETIGNDPQNPQKNRQLTFRLTGSDIQPDSNITLAIGQKSASYDAIVPTSAIRTDNNGSFVLAIVSKSTPLSTRYTATRVDVQVLASDDKSSAVSGIGSGEFVITTSTKPIEAGTQVRLAENG